MMKFSRTEDRATVKLNSEVSSFSFLVGSFTSVLSSILKLVLIKRSTIILPCSLHDLAAAWKDESTASLYKKVGVCTTDGMPLVWLMRWRTGLQIERVYGPDLMRAVLIRTQGQFSRHFFLGSTRNVLLRFQKQLVIFAPCTNVVGALHLPQMCSESEEAVLFKRIEQSEPSVLWIGIGSPKQVQLAVKLKNKLPHTVIFCVGAAVELLASVKPTAPALMRQFGLEWFFRLVSEPKRLWKRYLLDIPLFLGVVVLRFLRKRSLPFTIS